MTGRTEASKPGATCISKSHAEATRKSLVLLTFIDLGTLFSCRTEESSSDEFISSLNKCWPLSRLRESSDVSRMPDEDRGQLCIP